MGLFSEQRKYFKLKLISGYSNESLALLRLRDGHFSRGEDLQAGCQYQQHFTRAFFADILAPKNFKPKTQRGNFLCQNIG